MPPCYLKGMPILCDLSARILNFRAEAAKTRETRKQEELVKQEALKKEIAVGKC